MAVLLVNINFFLIHDHDLHLLLSTRIEKINLKQYFVTSYIKLTLQIFLPFLIFFIKSNFLVCSTSLKVYSLTTFKQIAWPLKTLAVRGETTRKGECLSANAGQGNVKKERVNKSCWTRRCILVILCNRRFNDQN